MARPFSIFFFYLNIHLFYSHLALLCLDRLFTLDTPYGRLLRAFTIPGFLLQNLPYFDITIFLNTYFYYWAGIEHPFLLRHLETYKPPLHFISRTMLLKRKDTQMLPKENAREGYTDAPANTPEREVQQDAP